MVVGGAVVVAHLGKVAPTMFQLEWHAQNAQKRQGDPPPIP